LSFLAVHFLFSPDRAEKVSGNFAVDRIMASKQPALGLPVSRLERRLGDVRPDVLRRIREALAFATGMA
jgi:hypothetical protein